MNTAKPSLDDLLGRADLRDAAAGRIASALAGWPAAASPIGPEVGMASVTAASPTPIPTAASPIGPDVGVASATADAFASAIVTRLGFASADKDVLSVLAARVASALGGIPDFADQRVAASTLGAFVASAVGARIVASPEFADILNSRLTEIMGASRPAAPLSRRKSVDD